MISTWKLLFSASLVFFGTLAMGCGSQGDAPTASISDPSAETAPGESAPNTPAGQATLEARPEFPPPAVVHKDLFPEVLIKTSLGNIKVRLNAETAPATVHNFLDNYVSRGFYSDTIFHYVDSGVIVAGGYTSDLQAKPAGAPIFNESRNGLKNERGTIAMARSPEYSDSATSQFFINLVDNDSLDYDEESENAGYCVFGQVVEGIEVADQIGKAEVQEHGEFQQLPVQTVTIQSIDKIEK